MRLTVQCGIIKLTKRKRELLDREYDNLQEFLRGNKEIPLYSANKQQALRYYKKVKQKEYPLSLRRDLINLRKAKSFWFLKIPVYGVYGGIRVPVKPHRDFPKSKPCESKIVRRNRGQYLAMLSFELGAPPTRRRSSAVLAIDLGERFAATAVLLKNRNVVKAGFYGREIRGIRRHYSWLRERLQERGLNRVIKKIGQKERRCVNSVLHKVSKEIVCLADSSNSVIAIGDLKGMRQRVTGRNKSKRLNRIVSSMPHHRLTNMIMYKAVMRGLQVVTVSEAYTSTTCHVCNNLGQRDTGHGHFSQGRFVCRICGEYNADLNAAINIGKKVERFLGYMPLNGADREPAQNQAGILTLGSLSE